jgi:hypothetical protein
MRHARTAGGKAIFQPREKLHRKMDKLGNKTRHTRMNATTGGGNLSAMRHARTAVGTTIVQLWENKLHRKKDTLGNETRCTRINTTTLRGGNL